jgi:hypothetical protein
MSGYATSLSDIEPLAQRAVACNLCFETLPLTRPSVALAQPRFIGCDYWTSHPRIVVVMLNPGSGGFRRDSADTRFHMLLQEYRRKRKTLADVFAHQLDDVHNWGRGKFCQFYFEGLALRPDQVAFANVAWCATQGNKYPHRMLRNCFKHHTLPLLRLLSPGVILLSGSRVHSFRDDIAQALPCARIVSMLHYAHRESGKAERDEFRRVRREIRGTV